MIETKLKTISVTQKCHDCGQEFNVKYTSTGYYEYTEIPCDCEDNFSPINGQPSIEQWLAQLAIENNNPEKQINHYPAIIKNCSNCRVACAINVPICNADGRYVCDEHELTDIKPIVYIASALRGDIKNNLIKAGIYTRLAINSQVLPITPHLNWAAIFNDLIIEERILGMSTGAEFLLKCAAIWVFGFISDGVQGEIDLALQHGIPVYLIDHEALLTISSDVNTIEKIAKSGLFPDEKPYSNVECSGQYY